MTARATIAATERTAAAMLDMPLAEFRRLVEAGALPGPVRIGPHERWRVSDLTAILNGEAMQDEFTP